MDVLFSPSVCSVPLEVVCSTTARTRVASNYNLMSFSGRRIICIAPCTYKVPNNRIETCSFQVDCMTVINPMCARFRTVFLASFSRCIIGVASNRRVANEMSTVSYFSFKETSLLLPVSTLQRPLYSTSILIFK